MDTAKKLALEALEFIERVAANKMINFGSQIYAIKAALSTPAAADAPEPVALTDALAEELELTHGVFGEVDGLAHDVVQFVLERIKPDPLPSEFHCPSCDLVMTRDSANFSDGADWARYVAGCVVAYLEGDVDDPRIDPIAGIIARRLWGLPKSGYPIPRAAIAASQPAPVEKNVRWELCKHCGHDMKDPCHKNDNPNLAANCHWNQEHTRVLGTGLVNNRPPAPVEAKAAPSEVFLCRAWGESDHPCAELVADWNGVRDFMVREWLGAADATDYDGTVTLDRLKEDFDEHEADERGGPLEYTFEIGGVSVERVTGFSTPVQALAVAVPDEQYIRDTARVFFDNEYAGNRWVRWGGTPEQVIAFANAILGAAAPTPSKGEA